MACHEGDAGRHQFGGHLHGLARVASVIQRLERKAFAAEASGGVVVVDRLLRTPADLFSEHGVGTGEGSRRADEDLGQSRWSGEDERKACGGEEGFDPHLGPVLCLAALSVVAGVFATRWPDEETRAIACAGPDHSKSQAA